MIRKASNDYMQLTHCPIPVQVCIFLPTPPPGSGSEADIAAGMPTVEVVVDKEMVDVEVGCANGVHYIVQV